MLQPYRQSFATCLDSMPRITCPPRGRIRARLAIAVLFAIGITGSFAVGAAAAVQNDGAGRIELGPAALVHAKHNKKTVKPQPPRDEEQRATQSRLHVVKPWLVGSHDPEALLSGARKLQVLGMDVTATEVDLPMRAGVNETWDAWLPAQWLPVSGYSGHVAGLELRGVGPGSLLQLAGLQDGDQLLGIDGFVFDNGTFPSVDTAAIQKHHRVTLEIARGDHHVVLSIRWRAVR